MIRKAFVAMMPIALAACASVGELPVERIASATILSGSGQPAGTAELVGQGDTLSLKIALTGISPGLHGTHLHTVGKCEAPDFKSAGGHLNPAHKEHGMENPKGRHLGDLPNMNVAADGTASMTVPLNGEPASLMSDMFDADGTAIVVHAGPDDYMSDPAGNAGGRIACGVFKRI
ncbi:superoxide dismutase [Croceicoccus estronivorus]|uniref:superoxide dismutase family protein n=1 Tax=Croceicoccus estronivorus TaxID=1172626 RepID=UPI00082D9730|nr:superoxide dismutase family protein [Croceicoccus estronivorus]OCC24449.1 superoxide dismutase [Croceicoccus estronivorus]